MNKYIKNKYHNDINFKLRALHRSRTNIALKNNSKHFSSRESLGCSIKNYKEYLENQFDSNMNWENWGPYWEIDHIIPLNTFDLSKRSNQLIGFNFKNTRPLEKSLNRSRPKNGADI